MITKRIKGWMAGVLACCMLLTGCQIGDKSIVVLSILSNRYVFSIGEASCSVKEARLYLTNYRNIYGNAYTLDLWQHDFGEASLEDYIRTITLNNLVTIMSMTQLAEEKGLVLTEEDEAAIAEAALAYYESLTEAEHDYLGVSVSDLVEYYRHYAMAKGVYQFLTSEINNEVSDDEARVMDVMQIYVTDGAKASEIQEKLQNGEDFASVANMYNELPNIQANICRDDVAEDAEKVIFQLDDNEVTDIIKVEGGYYFVKCLNKFNQQLTEENKGIIVEKREKEALDNVYNEFVKGMSSHINEEVWESVGKDITSDIKTDSFFDFYDGYCN